MKNLFALLCASVFIFSCTNELDDYGQEIDSGNEINSLNFSNFQEFLDTYEKLSEMNTKDELFEWIDSRNFGNSYLSYQYQKPIDTTSFDQKVDLSESYSEALKAILNKDFELVIGSDRIKLLEGRLVKINPKNKEEFDLNSNVDVLGEIVNSTVKSETSQTDLESRQFNANSSFTFYKNFNATNGRNCLSGTTGSNRERRFVHRLFTETIYQNGSVVSSKLLMSFSVEAKYCSVWKCKWERQDGEARKIDVNNLGVYYLNNTSVNRYLGNFSTNCITGIYTLQIAGTGTCQVPLSCFPLSFPANLGFGGSVSHTHYYGFNSNQSYTWNQLGSSMN